MQLKDQTESNSFRYVSLVEAVTKEIQPMPDTFSVSPASKGITDNDERPTMDINDLFDGIMKVLTSFPTKLPNIGCKEKIQETGRGPENGG